MSKAWNWSVFLALPTSPGYKAGLPNSFCFRCHEFFHALLASVVEMEGSTIPFFINCLVVRVLLGSEVCGIKSLWMKA